MNIFCIYILQLAFVIGSVEASRYSYGSQIGWTCKTSLTNITFECLEPSTCICENAQRRSLVYCSMTHTRNRQEFDDSLMAIKAYCPALSNEIYENDAKIAPTEVKSFTSEELAHMNVSSPIIIPHENYEFAHACVRALYGQLTKSGELGTLIIAFWFSISLVQTSVNQLNRVFPRTARILDNYFTRSIRKHVMLPATFGYTHSSVISFYGYSFSIPTRFETLIIILHSLLNIAIYIPEYSLIEGNWFGSPLKYVQFQGFLGWRSGVFAIVHVPLLYLFAGRNNLLIALTGWSMDTFNVYHRWLARWTMIHTAIHTIAYFLDFKNLGYLSIAWSQPYWLHGIAAGISGALLIVHGVHYLRSKHYEAFLVLHIILAVAFTVMTYSHVYYITGNSGGTVFVWCSILLWASDRMMRIFRIYKSGLYCTAETELYADGIIKMIVSYSNSWDCRPGQYVFIHVLKWNMFLQSHPFTIIESPNDDCNKLVLLIKTRNGFSKKLNQELNEQLDKSLRYRVLVDGPYGDEKHLDHYDNVILIGGGIGITGVYCYASWIKKQKLNIRVVLIWCISSRSSLGWFKDELGFLCQDERFDVRVYASPVIAIATIEPTIDKKRNKDSRKQNQENLKKSAAITYGSHLNFEHELISQAAIQVKYERIKIDTVLEEEITSSIGSTAVMCCGPGSLNDDVRCYISHCLHKSQSRVDYFEESFSW